MTTENTGARALVVGAGICGLAASIALAGEGLEVELVERQTDIEALGSGITLIGPALRALRMLGVADECLAEGYGVTTFETVDVHGELASSFELPSPVGDDLPGMLGIMRPALHRVLLDQAYRSGATIRTRTRPTSLEVRPDAVDVTFDGGDRATYDLVVGADGLRSSVRELLFGPMPQRFLGQGCVRVTLPRPARVTGEIQYQPAGDVFVGFTPTSAQSMYMYCSFPLAEDCRPTPVEIVELVRRKTAPFAGLLDEVRDHMVDPGQVNLARFHTVLAPHPWSRGRAVIVGDAAHCPAPQLAAGAAMCLEDAVALGAEVAAAPSIEDALPAFSARRHDRCRFVVETSSLLSRWQTYPGSSDQDHERVTADAFAVLSEPF